MTYRAIPAAFVLGLATTVALHAQTQAEEPVFDGRPLSAWVSDLKAAAPQTRNAAAYVISGMGPAAKAAVPALIEALDDPVAAVRYPVAVALREIGPAAAAAVPALRRALNDSSDDVAAMARKALIAITGEDPGPPED